jgi:hypothetical protein
MSDNLKTKTVLLVDNGLFHNWALKLAQSFGRVLYYSPWQSGFPSQKQTRLGDGFAGVERCNYPQAVEDEIDLFVFVDLFQADWQARLRAQGRRVWGMGDSEDVELERWAFRQWCERNGLKLNPAKLVTGMDALRAYLQERKDVFVKMARGINRGDMETWKWKGEFISTPRLDQQVYDLGSFKDDTEFLVEDEQKDAIELGEDLFTVDGQWPEFIMQGMEIKGLGTVGIVKPYAQLPQCLRDFNSKLAKVFKADTARTFFCMEGLYNKARQYTPMDPCVRLGSPSNELLAEMFDGWAETLWWGAEGKMVSPKPVAKYGIVAMAYNENSGKNWQPLKYPPSMDRWVKLRNPYAIGGKRYAVPQGSPTNLAGIVGTGKTLLEAAAAMGEHAQAVDGNQVEIATDSISKMLDVVKKANDWGATWTTDPLPTAERLKRAAG